MSDRSEADCVSNDLVERVARKIAEAYVADVSHGQLTLADSEYHWSDWRLEARAAIAVVLEEAADAVGEVGDHAEVGAYINAIRALKEEK